MKEVSNFAFNKPKQYQKSSSYFLKLVTAPNTTFLSALLTVLSMSGEQFITDNKNMFIFQFKKTFKRLMQILEFRKNNYVNK